LAGGGEPAGNEAWSMGMGLSVAGSMAAKRMRPEKREVGYMRCISASASFSQSVSKAFTYCGTIWQRCSGGFDSSLRIILNILRDFGRSAGRDRFCIDGVAGPACFTGVAAGLATGMVNDVGKPDRGGAALRPNFFLARNCLNLSGFRRSLTIIDVGSAVSSRAVFSRYRHLEADSSESLPSFKRAPGLRPLPVAVRRILKMPLASKVSAAPGMTVDTTNDRTVLCRSLRSGKAGPPLFSNSVSVSSVLYRSSIKFVIGHEQALGIELALLANRVRNGCCKFTREREIQRHLSGKLLGRIERVVDVPFELIHQSDVSNGNIELYSNAHVIILVRIVWSLGFRSLASWINVGIASLGLR
ncbi:hypothetical protein KCU85_g255, partial [Aureobasidium melanogenum]